MFTLGGGVSVDVVTKFFDGWLSWGLLVLVEGLAVAEDVDHGRIGSCDSGVDVRIRIVNWPVVDVIRFAPV